MKYNSFCILCLAIAGVFFQSSTSHAQGEVADSWLQRANPAFSEITLESNDPLDVVQILDMAGNVLVKKTLEGQYKTQASINRFRQAPTSCGQAQRQKSRVLNLVFDGSTNQ